MADTTLRDRIMKLLSNASKPLTVTEIISELGLDISQKRMIYEELRHVAKSVWRRSRGTKMLFMEPPMCKSCGYVFKDLDKPRKPSKCPRCGSERIYEPRFIIREV